MLKRPQVEFRDVARSMGGVAVSVGRWFAKDPLNTLLIVASLGLTFLFFNLLGEIQPSTGGERVPLSRDHQARRGEEDRGRDAARPGRPRHRRHQGRPGPLRRLPESDAQTSSLVKQLTAGGAMVQIDQQSDKPAKQIVVQFLIPILLLVCLFVLFTRIGQDGGAGAFAGFSKFTGKGRKRGAERPRPDHLRRRRRRRRGGRRAARDPRLPRRPGQIRGSRRAGPEGRAAGRPARHRQDAAGEGDRGRGRRGLLLALGLGLRRVAGRRRRGAASATSSPRRARWRRR